MKYGLKAELNNNRCFANQYCCILYIYIQFTINTILTIITINDTAAQCSLKLTYRTPTGCNDEDVVEGDCCYINDNIDNKIPNDYKSNLII